jgi:glucose-1-phosphate thymidylyltransferase
MPLVPPQDLPIYNRLLGDARALGLSFSYAAQPTAGGIAQAFIIGREFAGADSVALILGDNIFYGQGLSDFLRKALAENTGATTSTIVVRHVLSRHRTVAHSANSTC